MVRCEECGKKFNAEIEIEVINEIYGRYVECPYCKDKYPIDFYDPELQTLVNRVNLRAGLLQIINLEVEGDLEIENLSKRINNLSDYIMKEALRRSDGKPCYVQTTNLKGEIE